MWWQRFARSAFGLLPGGKIGCLASARLLTQAEKELKEELEVKLAVSSMVCSVADKVSAQRLEQSSLEVVRLEEMRKAGVMESESSLKAELAKTNAVVASLKADIGVARAWQTGVDNLEVKLMARIEELRTMAEVRLWDLRKWEKLSCTSTSF